MMRRDTLRGNSRTGSVMVELSLVGLVFFVLLVGIMDLGQFLFIQQALLDRARYAARWGSVTDPTNVTAIKNMVLYQKAAAPKNGTKPFFRLTADMITVSTADSGTDKYRLALQISGYSYTVLSPYLAGSYTGVPIRVSVPLGLYH